jgi:hypothetical protein
MKKILVSLIVTTLFLVNINLYAAEQKTYTNPILNFTINYPSDWQMQQGMNMIAFLSSLESQDDKFRENVNLLFEDLSNNPMDLEQYMKFSEENAPKLIQNYHLIDKGSMQLGDQKADYLLYEGVANGYSLRFKSYTFIKDSKAYTVTYTAEPGSFDKFSTVAEGVMKSINMK